MNQLISHIEFLLHKHNCVIVPDLGGFVVNTTPCRRDGISAFEAPSCELVFNRDLTYNDGLLAQSLMEAKRSSFEAASQEIATAVKQLKQELKSAKYVDLGDLGNFTMTDDYRFVYNPKPFIRPENFGLTKVSLKPIIQIQPKLVAESGENNGKKTIVRYAKMGAVAAIVALLMFIFPFDSGMRFQSAPFGADRFLGTVKTDNAPIETRTAVVSKESRAIAGILPGATSFEEIKTNTPNPDIKKYFVVVGVYLIPKVAQDMVEQLKSEGFSDVLTMENKERIYVCADSFDTFEEVDSFLRALRKDFPHYADAWVFKKN